MNWKSLTIRKVKSSLKGILPQKVLGVWRKYKLDRIQREFSELSVGESFAKIYSRGAWERGRFGARDFYSGSGSHDPNIVAPYVDSVREFLSSFSQPPDVVDLGCGDFSVGSQIRDLCANYVACDIVAPLIERNRELYTDRSVEFRVLDITEGQIPSADVIIIRQVLQHLSNAQIELVVKNLPRSAKYLLVTEHVPSEDFIENLDKPVGPGIRLFVGSGSGVVLTAKPFNLLATKAQTLCEVPGKDEGVIRSTLYEF